MPSGSLHAGTGADVTATLDTLHRIIGTAEHVELIADCLTRLDLFRLSRQLDVLDTLLAASPGRAAAAS